MTHVLGVHLIIMSGKFGAGECVIICDVPTSKYEGNPCCVDYVGVIHEILDVQYRIRVIGTAQIVEKVYYVGSAQEESILKYAKDLTRFSDIKNQVHHVEGDPDVVEQLMQSLSIGLTV